MIRVSELFAGIGACSKALTNLGIELEEAKEILKKTKSPMLRRDLIKFIRRHSR